MFVAFIYDRYLLSNYTIFSNTISVYFHFRMTYVTIYVFRLKMNEPKIKRRYNTDIKIGLPLEFQLIMLLNSRKEMLFLCTKSSLALRIVILCDLFIQNNIEMKNGTVKVVKGTEGKIRNEFLQKISQVSFSPKDTFKYLNGEKNGLKGITGLRKSIYLEMETHRLIEIKKSHLFNKIKILNHDCWKTILEKIVDEAQNNRLTKETIVLLLGLNYVDRLEAVLLQCSETVAKMIVDQVNQIKERMVKRQYSESDQLMYKFLEILEK